MKNTFIVVSAVILLAACGDKAQTAGGVKQDAAAFTGTGKPYVEPGWKQGDKTSWESHLRARMQSSQNDYSKAN